MGGECKAPAGSVFWVKHTFLPPPTWTDAQTWIDGLATFDMPGYKSANLANGVDNAVFMIQDLDPAPNSVGPDIMCVWETKEKMSPLQFQEFIDGPLGPASGKKVFFNNIYEVLPGAGK